MRKLAAKKTFFTSRKFLRKIQILLKFTSGLLIIFCLVTLLLYVFKADFFKVRWLECQSNDGQMCQEKETVFLNDLKERNLFLINSKKEGQRFKKELLWIKEIDIKKRLPDKLLIIISRRQPTVIFTKDEKVWYISDEEGFIFSKTTKKINDLLTVFLPRDFPIDLGVEIDFRLKFVVDLAKILKKEFIFIDKAYFDFPTLTLFLDSSRIASLSAQKPADLQVGSLQFILRQSKIEGKLPGLIDLRFSKPVIKY